MCRKPGQVHFQGEGDCHPPLPKGRQTHASQPVGWVPLTRVCLLGVLLALAPDDEHEDQKQDEDEADQCDDHQEPPLLVERVGFLGWDTDGESGPGCSAPLACKPPTPAGTLPPALSLRVGGVCAR